MIVVNLTWHWGRFHLKHVTNNAIENVYVYQGGFWHCIWLSMILSGLRFGKSSSPIIGEWMKLIPVYLWGVPARKTWRDQINRTILVFWLVGNFLWTGISFIRCLMMRDEFCRRNVAPIKLKGSPVRTFFVLRENWEVGGFRFVRHWLLTLVRD